jgi:hypothetical protein
MAVHVHFLLVCYGKFIYVSNTVLWRISAFKINFHLLSFGRKFSMIKTIERPVNGNV